VFAVSADNSTCVNRTLQWRWLETQKFSNASVIDLQKKETDELSPLHRLEAESWQHERMAQTQRFQQNEP
jgi:hypothetical protein